jgi:competence ComEA-like helix-hairpin-helix protein
MNVTSTVRRSDQPLQIGGRHGYRIDGDSAHLNAELSVPPYHPGGAWALELWASEQAYRGGELSGVKVSEVQFELPTPIAPHTHRVEAQAPARLPLQGVAHTMLLALVERGAGERRIHDVTSYPELETFPAPRFQGEVGYEIRGHELMLQAEAVTNPRPEGNLSGTLSVELWATPVDSEEAPETGQGHCLGAAQFAPVAGGESAFDLYCRAAFLTPPPGTFRLELLLREWTRALGYLTRDRRTFGLAHQQAPEALDVAQQPESVLPEAAVLAQEPALVLSEPALTLPEPAVAEQPALVAPEPAAVAEQPALVAPEPVVVATSKPVLPPPPAPKSAPAAVQAAPAVALEAVVLEAVALEAVALQAVAAPAAEVPAPAAAVQAAPVARANSRVSIQTASVDELARVKGLNTKVAKEIIKGRPFASLDDLVKVQGIGRKTFDKIRSLLTL